MIGRPNLRAEARWLVNWAWAAKFKRLQHHAVGVSAVARETANHVAALEVAIGQSRAGGDGHAAADDGIGAQMADA